ncbi:M23 family metallopeptidase [Gordonia sp. ABSL1-1]|uniref:M23 family metallopeptidase n=1 Tax=Gordonia sp. ABSL1-1 TaxID=3053923 RepID=UPI00257388AA|nr:M23 family metallopeptidase [Gordonia sp. ABSL1-1]MDL9937975.1 M23 family metallopeptidase [Gordonia sp. ABSL1-1]
MDDLAGSGAPRGSASPRSGGYPVRSGNTLIRDDLAAEEMTTIIPVDDTDIDTHTWTPSTWDGYYRPSHAEITQDILIPEHEFDEFLHDEPFEVDGARLDSFDEHERGSVESDELPFRSNPDGQRAKRGGKHRISAPPTALRGGRAALFAMAAGATVAAITTGNSTGDTANGPVNAATVTDTGATVDLGPGVASSATTPDMDVYSAQLKVGAALHDAADRAEAAARRPLFMSPINFGAGGCSFTSTYANRWGSLHGGIDLACPLGTPIHAATDGVVIAAEPASGYGHWVQIQAADGTVTMYGHMSSSGVLVRAGQHVTAGDVIALVGSEGFSTGPHLHFEVWKNGHTKIDPAPWLASKGIRLPNYSG